MIPVKEETWVWPTVTLAVAGHLTALPLWLFGGEQGNAYSAVAWQYINAVTDMWSLIF